MNKELDEAWTTIYHYNEEIIHDMGSEYVENPLKEEIDIVNNALLELKAIKEAKPSKAFECLEELSDKAYKRYFFTEKSLEELKTPIKQYILKAQQSEKANARNEEILQKFYQEGITLDSVRALKQERDNYKKALSIIKEKDVDIESFYKTFIEDDFNYLDYQIMYGTYGLELLTKEEFDLLKEVLECQNTEITKKK